MSRPSWIIELGERGSAPYSRASSTKARKILSTLQSLGLVKVETHQSRRRVVVLDARQFARWVKATYPMPDGPLEKLAARARNVACHRDSKWGPAKHPVQPLLLKWFDADPGSELSRLTRQYGMVGMASDRLAQLDLPDRWSLLTVENWEPFYVLDYGQLQVPIMTVYLGGNISGVLLEALSALRPAPARVLHFGDYDWSGLAIFQRVERFLEHAQLYLSPNLEALFQQYGRRALLEQPRTALNLEHAKCQRVIELIARYNAGLEQEIVPAPTAEDLA